MPHEHHYLALVQVTGAAALRARVPAALARGETLLHQTARAIAEDVGGMRRETCVSGLLFSFDAADRAAIFSASLQEELLHVDWPATLLVRPEAAVEVGGARWLYRGLRARIALHRAGPCDFDDAGFADGSATYQVARMAAVAHGGQVLTSDTFAADLSSHSTIGRRDLGFHALPGVDGETRLFELVPPDLSERVFPQIPTQTTRRSNLPPGGSQILGRHGDLGALSELLSLGVRSVSVIGEAGLGKGLLVRQFARARTGDPRFFGGTWFANVAGGSVQALVRAVGWALGIVLDEVMNPEQAVDRIGHALAARGPLLLVVDGLVDPASEVVAALDTWLRTAPKLTIVANTIGAGPAVRTSGQVQYELRPLELPTSDNARSNDAVKLFSTYARSVDEDFAVENPDPIVEIVRRVEGNPAALRLLAGFVDRVPPDQQLDTVVRAGGTLDDLLERLLDHLDSQETDVLIAAAALVGSFDVRALGAESAEPLVVLERLERRGLVRGQPDASASQVSRYLVEDRVRRVVLARLPLEETREREARRANALLVACERFARGAGRADHPEVVSRIAVELDGLLQVVEQGLDPGLDDPSGVQLALRGCLALEPLLEARGPSFLALELSDRALRRSDAVLGCDPLLQLRVLLMRARALRRAGRLNAARVDLDRAISIAERWSDTDGVASAKIERALVSLREGGVMEAVAELRPAASGESPPGDPARHASALAVLGRASALALLPVDADRLLRSAASTQQRLGAFVDATSTLEWLAALHEQTGVLDEAHVRWEEVIVHARRLGWRGLASRAHSALGLLDVRCDRGDRSQDHLVEAAREARLAGDRRGEALALRTWGLVALVEDELDQARELFLEALAIDRDRADRAAEGADVGFAGVVAHLAEQADAARASYRRAIQLLGDVHHAPLAAIFGAWAAALAAEEGDPTSRDLYQAALARHAEDPEADAAEVLHQIRGTIDLFEANVAEGSGDAEGASRWRSAARHRWEEGTRSEVPLPIVARLVHTRVGRQLAQLSSE